MVNRAIQALKAQLGMAARAFGILQLTVYSLAKGMSPRHESEAHHPATNVSRSPALTAPQGDTRKLASGSATGVIYFFPICVQRFAVLPNLVSQDAHLQVTNSILKLGGKG